jgi:hypothetical protein
MQNVPFAGSLKEICITYKKILSGEQHAYIIKNKLQELL